MGKPENELIEATIQEIMEDFPEFEKDLKDLEKIIKKIPVPSHRILGMALSKSYEQWISRLLGQ